MNITYINAEAEDIAGIAAYNFEWCLDQLRGRIVSLLSGRSDLDLDPDEKRRLRHMSKRVTITVGPRGSVIECDPALFRALVAHETAHYENFKPIECEITVVLDPDWDHRTLETQLTTGLRINCRERGESRLVDGKVETTWS